MKEKIYITVLLNKNKPLLNLEKLVKIRNDQIFDNGLIKIEQGNNTKELRWVAVKRISNWTILYHLTYKTDNWIANQGNKMKDESLIKTLVPCDESTFAMYK